TSDDTSLRERILKNLDIVFGVVPTYEIHRRIRRHGQEPRSAVLGVLEEHARQGVDFVTIHASGTLEMARGIRDSTRVIPVTSRGGAMIAEVMLHSGAENPYLTNFDDILDLCRAHGMALSLAGTYRPGTIADAM